jgi:hypothetical protein
MIAIESEGEERIGRSFQLSALAASPTVVLVSLTTVVD